MINTRVCALADILHTQQTLNPGTRHWSCSTRHRTSQQTAVTQLRVDTKRTVVLEHSVQFTQRPVQVPGARTRHFELNDPIKRDVKSTSVKYTSRWNRQFKHSPEIVKSLVQRVMKIQNECNFCPCKLQCSEPQEGGRC